MSKLRSLALFVRPILWAIPMGYLAIGSETYAQKPVTYKGVCAISIAFSADSQLLAAGGYKADQPHAIGFVNVWNINKHKSVFVFSDPRNHFKSLAFSPVNHVLAAGSVGPNPAVTTWDVNTGKMQMELAQRTNVDCLALSPDGKKIAIATFDKDGPLLTVLELSSKKLVQSFRGNKKGINAVAFSPNGQLIASAGFDGVVRVVSVKTGEVVASYLGHNSPVSSIAFTPDGKHLISGSMSGAIRLLQVSPKSREVYTFQGPDGGVWSIAVEPTGHWLLLGGFKLPSDKGRGKGVVQIWDLRKKLHFLKKPMLTLPAAAGW
jgi:WD40 repeat protein